MSMYGEKGGGRCEDIVHSVVCMYVRPVCAAACDITCFPAVSPCCQFTRNDGESPINDVTEIRRLTSAKSPAGRACVRARVDWYETSRRAYYSTLNIYTACATWRASHSTVCRLYLVPRSDFVRSVAVIEILTTGKSLSLSSSSSTLRVESRRDAAATQTAVPTALRLLRL